MRGCTTIPWAGGFSKAWNRYLMDGWTRFDDSHDVGRRARVGVLNASIRMAHDGGVSRWNIFSKPSALPVTPVDLVGRRPCRFPMAFYPRPMVESKELWIRRSSSIHQAMSIVAEVQWHRCDTTLRRGYARVHNDPVGWRVFQGMESVSHGWLDTV